MPDNDKTRDVGTKRPIGIRSEGEGGGQSGPADGGRTRDLDQAKECEDIIKKHHLGAISCTVALTRVAGVLG